MTDAIRTPEVSEAGLAGRRRSRPSAPRWSASSAGCWPQGDWVAEGRDIGTVVAPDAEVKVFLDRRPEERARRRAAELGVDPATVLAEQAIRDERDRTRARLAAGSGADAVELDTTGLTLDEVVRADRRRWSRAAPRHA